MPTASAGPKLVLCSGSRGLRGSWEKEDPPWAPPWATLAHLGLARCSGSRLRRNLSSLKPREFEQHRVTRCIVCCCFNADCEDQLLSLWVMNVAETGSS